MELTRREKKRQVRRRLWRKLMFTSVTALFLAVFTLAWVEGAMLAAVTLLVLSFYTLLLTNVSSDWRCIPIFLHALCQPLKTALYVIASLLLLAYAYQCQLPALPQGAPFSYIHVFPRGINAPVAEETSGENAKPSLFTYTAADDTDSVGELKQYKVTAVPRGEVLVLANGQEVRLIGVEVPEKYQADAIRVLTAAVLYRYATIEICSFQPYDECGRLRAVAYANGRNLNTTLIELGYSKIQPMENCHVPFADWSVYQQAAVRQKRGMWRN